MRPRRLDSATNSASSSRVLHRVCLPDLLRIKLYRTHAICRRISPMKTDRLEAFSDGVIAILITIMVLELKVPHEASFSALGGLVPVLLSYLMSFIYLGIYWNNHHH